MKIDYPITFFYYRDLTAVVPFYQETLGLPLVVDQGWAKIFAVGPAAYVGLVDEARGSVRATPDKAVLLTLVVEDVDGWHARLADAGVLNLTAPRLHEQVGVYGFFAQDPGGYKLEFQRFV